MSARDHLWAIAAGQRPANDGLLSNCRFEWRGAEMFGEEAILESFRAAPLSTEGLKFLESPSSAALIGHQTALIGDIFDERVGRLWRLGAGARPALEPTIAVSFDPDLQQARGGLSFRVEDHPDLRPEHAEQMISAGRDLVASEFSRSMHRVRSFGIRAFSCGDDAAALFALHRLTGGEVRSPSWGYAVAVTNGPLIIDPISTGPVRTRV